MPDTFTLILYAAGSYNGPAVLTGYESEASARVVGEAFIAAEVFGLDVGAFGPVHRAFVVLPPAG